MSRRKTGATPVAPLKQKKKMVVNMTRVELAKARIEPGFRTGRHMTEKDRPRRKKWEKELERDDGSSSFLLHMHLHHF